MKQTKEVEGLYKELAKLGSKLSSAERENKLLKSEVKNLKQETMLDTLLTSLLNMKCSRTGHPIKSGEVVKLFDWGTNRVPFGYGAYVWDEQERGFILQMNHTLNDHAGYSSTGIDDRYDLFRTTPEKLTPEEKKLLKQLS